MFTILLDYRGHTKHGLLLECSRPFPILTAIALGPPDLAPLLTSKNNSFFSNFEMTPLYVGFPYSRTVGYKNGRQDRVRFDGRDI